MVSIKGGTRQLEASPRRAILLSALRGAIAGLLLSFAAVLVFALAIKILMLSDAVIPIVSQVIKVCSIVVAGLYACRSHASQGWLKGAVAGFVYVLLAYLFFSLVQGDWSAGLPLVYDLLMGAGIGAASGVIAVNTRRK